MIGSNGNYIFLPAAGFRHGTSLDFAGEYGFFWSAMLNESNTNHAYALGFGNNFFSGSWNNNRYYGYPVRPVSE